MFDPTPYRLLYPYLNSGLVYMNHAAISPMSQPVTAALQEYIHQCSTTDVENYFAFQPTLAETRHWLAELLHTQPEHLAWVANTSTGLNILATGLAWQPGERILINPLEFPANVYPFLNCQRLGVAVDFVQPRGHYLALEDFAAALTPRTRLLSVSYVQFLTGQRMDLQALGQMCKENGTLFCVDGIQALGATDVDVNACQIDFLASGCHKWLMGPQGLGFVYIRPELLAQLQPAYAGWTSVVDEWNMLDYNLTFKPSALRYELGTLNFMGIAGFHAALDVFRQVGMAGITEHISCLSEALHVQLTDLGLDVITPAAASDRLGIVSFISREPKALFQHLLQSGVEISLRGEYLRFSPHFYNTLDEVEQAVTVIRDFGE